MSKELLVDDFRFNGIINPAATASAVDGPFSKAVTASGGSPTVQAADGAMDLALDNTNEIQNLCFYQGDVLPYDIDQLVLVEIWAKITASVASSVSAAFGVASARNDAIDSIGEAALFRVDGNNSLFVETDDGTIDNDDKATGLSLSDTFRRCVIDFKTGVNSVSGGLSTGGKSRVMFSAENSQGLLRSVAGTTNFDMSNYSGRLQLFSQIQKTAATDVATLSIKRMRVTYQDD